jgi:hypothetical protein
MTEAEANLWLASMRDCLRANKADLSDEAYTQFNEIFRFLEEFCCPHMTQAACQRMGLWICPECGSRGYEASHICGDGS